MKELDQYKGQNLNCISSSPLKGCAKTLDRPLKVSRKHLLDEKSVLRGDMSFMFIRKATRKSPKITGEYY